MEEETRKELKKQLDDYYGDSRNDDHKEEIIDFIITRAIDLEYIINDFIFQINK